MKLSNIVPISLIKDYSGDFVMALANYLDPHEANEYEKAIISANLPIVLDNGAFETGYPDGVDNLLRKARRLNPAYVFAPDTLFDSLKTRKGYEIFKDIQKKTGFNFKIGVVVQANNEEDYLKEFIKYNEDPKVSVIGLSYLAISHSIKYPNKSKIPKSVIEKRKSSWNVFTDPDYTSDRIKMLEKIEKLGLKNIKPVHLLGLGKSYEDVLLATEKYPWCRYNDTSTCYIAATKGIVLSDKLEVEGGKIKDKIIINQIPDINTKKLLKLNINKLKYESNKP